MGCNYVDQNGYERGSIEHSDLVHRQIAYNYIYLPNRHLYPLRFREYQAHHRDGNKRNNAAPQRQNIDFPNPVYILETTETIAVPTPQSFSKPYW